jgi:hypothetical protein
MAIQTSLQAGPGHVSDDVSKLIEKARELARDGDFGSAAEQLNRKILAILPEDTGSMTRLAWSLVMRLEPMEAEALYKEVLRLSPDNLIARHRLSWLCGEGMRPGPTPHPAPVPAVRGRRPPKPPWRPQTFDVVVPALDAARFCEEMELPFYREEERDYKVAVHLVMSALLSPKNRAGANLPELVADVFGQAIPNLSALGLAAAQQNRVARGVEGTHGLRGAFSNLTGGRVGFWQFTWIPDAVAAGFGWQIADALCRLVNDSEPLAGRVDDFRSSFTDIAGHAKELGVRVVTGFQTSANFAALVLGGFDPHRYTFYMAGAMRHGYGLYAPGADWPMSCSVGGRYAEVCAFVASVEKSLRSQGVPVQDLIDAQSLIWIRFRPPANRQP